MKIPTKKLQNGFEMPVYGLGTWEMGGKTTHDPTNDDNVDIRAIQEAIQEGVTHIDTAESYADGYTEILVGRAIKECDRSLLFLASKVKGENLAYDDVIRAVQGSLERLKTDYLDLYYAHRYNPAIPVKETMRAMDTLVEEGLIKHIGVCNYTVEELEEAQSYAKNKIVVAQQHLNLKYRESEKRGVLKYCQENDMFFMAWRPLQKGLLINEASSILSEMAQKYHKTPAQIALNWLISQENVVTISKTRDVAHLKENLGALDWEMEPEDVKRLRNNYPNQEAVSDAVPLH